ncbi:MAG: DUF2182 domain-containing protein [Alphaproteobacteria bacterium]|jgi:predicted metal-binding membrane protein
MMPPATLPMVMMARRIMTDRKQSWERSLRTALLVMGYVATWTGFSLGVAIVQSGLQDIELPSPMLMGTSTFLTGLLFCAAGLFQFSKLKTACLERCRSPLRFFLGHWRDGRWGVFISGGISAMVFSVP